MKYTLSIVDCSSSFKSYDLCNITGISLSRATLIIKEYATAVYAIEIYLTKEN